MKNHIKHVALCFSVYAVCAASALFIASCGTTKKTEAVTAQISEQSQVQADSTKTVDTETKMYGDTLAGAGYIPFDAWQAPDSAAHGAPAIQPPDTSGNNTLTVDSKGAKITITATPVRDNKGKVVGTKLTYKAIAKPTQATTTHEVQKASVSTHTKLKATVKDNTKTVTTKGLSLPSWLWFPLIAVVLVFLFFIFKTPLLTWIKRIS
jgi:hypothetical protein